MSAPLESRKVAGMTAAQLVDLAYDYEKDMAFFSAAACLRAAADKLEAKGRKLQRAIDQGGHRP